jgi:glycerol-3-phosphate dehydrogenase
LVPVVDLVAASLGASLNSRDDDGSADPSAVTRDYTLRLDADAGSAPVLSVFGGKITTYRRLAEHALDQLASWFPGMRMAWTANTPLPGGDLDATPGALNARLAADYPALPPPLLHALARRHGTLTYRVLQGCAPRRPRLDFGAHLMRAKSITWLSVSGR